MHADTVGAALLDRDTDPADRSWAVQQMHRTTLIDALSAVQAVCRGTPAPLSGKTCRCGSDEG
jgi:hypothetical protein